MRTSTGSLHVQCRVAAIRGTVVDVQFEGALPLLGTAIDCVGGGGHVLAETHSHLNFSSTRVITVDSTCGLRRGAAVTGQDLQLEIPVGDAILGRMLDLRGQPIDGGPPLEAAERRPIHRAPPAARELSRRRALPGAQPHPLA